MAVTVNVVKQSDKDGSKKELIRNGNSGKEYRIEDLAPDGGWGWMVAAGLTIVFTVTLGPTSSFTIIFGDFLNSTGQGGSAITLLNSMFFISFSFSGLLTNMLLKNYSLRQVGVAGALIYAIPNILQSFVQHLYQMAFVTLVQGIGLGIMLTIVNTNFNAYFVKKRTMVMSATQVFVGLGGILYPFCIGKMMIAYGFRRTAALLGAIGLNCIFAMLTMHPVQWHAKVPKAVENEKVEPEEKILENNSLVLSDQKIEARRHSLHLFTGSERRHSVRSLKEHEAPLLIEAPKASDQRINKSHSDVEAATHLRSRTSSIQDLVKNRMSMLSAASVASIPGIGVISAFQHQAIGEETNASETAEEQKKGFKSKLADFFEVSLLKDGVFVNMSIGISLVSLGEMTFTSFLPLMMSSSGYTQSDAAYAITVSAIAELVSKILLTAFTMFFQVKNRYLFLVAMICMMFCKIGFLYCNSLTSTLVMNAVIGLARSWLFVLQPLVIAEHFGVEKFAAAYGLYTVLSGAIAIIFGPLVGFIKDLTNSFIVCQIVLLAMLVFSIVTWTIEVLVLDIFPRTSKKLDN